MWDRAGKALKRFWGALSGGKYIAGQTGPVNFENLQPIPVINVMEYGADDGDKAPKLYVPNDANGIKLVHDAVNNAVQDLMYERLHTQIPILLRSIAPMVTSYSNASATDANSVHKIAAQTFTSNAAGNLDADVQLVAALASYFGVVKIIGLFSVGNAGGTATLVIEDGVGGLNNLVSGTLVAGQLDTANQGMMLLRGTPGDNSAIYIDTTSAGLGNAQDYKLVYEYWYET